MKGRKFSTRAPLEEGTLPAPPHMRPVTRGDCASSPRPCPFAGCRYNLHVDVLGDGTLVRYGETADDLEESCALDVADKGGVSLQKIADVWGVSRERIRQIEEDAMGWLGRRFPRLVEQLSRETSAADARGETFRPDE